MGLEDRDWYQEAIKEKNKTKNKTDRNSYKYHFDNLQRKKKKKTNSKAYLIWTICFLIIMSGVFNLIGNLK